MVSWEDSFLILPVFIAFYVNAHMFQNLSA